MKYSLFLIFLFVSGVFCQWSEADKAVSAPNGGDKQTATYVIKTGDNLWNIAFKFLGDPFRWPEVWRRNAYVKNPNLIYPGNTLVISGTAQGLEQPSQQLISDAAGAPDASRSGFSTEEPWKQTAPKSGSAADHIGDSVFFTGLHGRVFLTAETIERSAFLWFDKDLKGHMYPGNGFVDKKESGGAMTAYVGDVYRQFEDLPIATYGDSPYRIGDTVDIFHSDRFVRFLGSTANVVRRVGRARITAARGPACTAFLFSAWDIVTAGDRVDTMTHARFREIDTLIDRDAVIKGSLFYHVEQTERPYLFHTFLCDRGSKDGVRFGDVFAVYHPNASETPRLPEAVACVVNVGAMSSTLRIEKLYCNSMEVGDSLELIKRIIFK